MIVCKNKFRDPSTLFASGRVTPKMTTEYEGKEETSPSVPTPSPQLPRKVLIAVDGSKGSRLAVEYACQNVVLNVDSVVLLHVRRHIDEIDFYSAEMYRMEFEQQYLKESTDLLESLTNLIKLLKPELPEGNLRKVSVTGDAREQILVAVKEEHASLLVVGSHGHSALARAFLGSVSDHLIHHSPCPVLVVRPAVT